MRQKNLALINPFFLPFLLFPFHSRSKDRDGPGIIANPVAPSLVPSLIDIIQGHHRVNSPVAIRQTTHRAASAAPAVPAAVRLTAAAFQSRSDVSVQVPDSPCYNENKNDCLHGLFLSVAGEGFNN